MTGHRRAFAGILLVLAIAATAQSAERLTDRDRADRAEAVGLFDQGKQMEAQRQYAKAHEKFSAAIRLYPGFVEAYVARGNMNSAMKKNDQAISDFSRAIDLDRRSAKAYNNRGIAYLNEKKYELAVADFTTAMDIDPSRTAYRVNRGIAYSNQKEHDKAIADYTNAIASEPANTDALAGRGAAYYATGDLKAAEGDLEKACSLGSVAACRDLKFVLKKEKKAKKDK